MAARSHEGSENSLRARLGQLTLPNSGLVSRIVYHTGPLIALGLLGRLDLLKSRFSEVLIPEAVRREIEPGGVNQWGGPLGRDCPLPPRADLGYRLHHEHLGH